MLQQNLEASIPAEKREAVEKAIRTAFNTTKIDSIVLLTGGLSSALVYKIVVNSTPYMLRIIMRIDMLTDPVRQYTCMNIAAQAGIAPYVHYYSIDDALSITDYVDAKPLPRDKASHEVLLRELAQTIKAIHSTMLFPKLVDFMDGVDIFIQQFKASGLLPTGVTEEHFRLYSEIQKAYPRHEPDPVSSHNDLNSNNILYDGSRIWIIDWEMAFQGDQYVDLANVANFFVVDDEQEELYLAEYFGESPDEYKRARFFLMRQVCHMFYAAGILTLAAASKPASLVPDLNMDTPSISEFRERSAAGAISLGTYEGQLQYGKILLNEVLSNMKTPRFAESISRILP